MIYYPFACAGITLFLILRLTLSLLFGSCILNSVPPLSLVSNLVPVHLLLALFCRLQYGRGQDCRTHRSWSSPVFVRRVLLGDFGVYGGLDVASHRILILLPNSIAITLRVIRDVRLYFHVIVYIQIWWTAAESLVNSHSEKNTLRPRFPLLPHPCCRALFARNTSRRWRNYAKGRLSCSCKTKNWKRRRRVWSERGMK